jgi:CheY-like chemotaxis protein
MHRVGRMDTARATLRVALADDEPAMRSALSFILHDLGAEVTEAVDGTGLQALVMPGHRYDVVVSDVSMPGLTGPAVVAEMRARGDATPVVFVTGSGSVADVLIASLSNVLMVAKPFTAEEIEHAVTTVASRDRRNTS